VKEINAFIQQGHIELIRSNSKDIYEQICCYITVSTNTSSVFASDHHITVISEGSFDTEDWSNDAEIQL